MSGKTALVAGATGCVGRHVVEYLIESSLIEKVFILCRSPNSIELWNHHPSANKISVCLLADDDWAGSIARIPPVDSYFCALGSTIKKAGSQENFRKIDFELPMMISRHVRDQGGNFSSLCSSVGANPQSSTFYLQVKGELEEGLRAMDWKHLQIVRPGILDNQGERAESRPAEAVMIWMSKYLCCCLQCGVLGKFSAIPTKSVGKAMAYEYLLHLTTSSRNGEAVNAPAPPVISALEPWIEAVNTPFHLVDGSKEIRTFVKQYETVNSKED